MTKAPRLASRIDVLASGFVALLALFISAYTVYIQRQQLKAQVWPSVSLDESLGGGPGGMESTVVIKNRGFAPATIRAMRVSVAGEDVTDWADWLRKLARKQAIPLSAPGPSMNVPVGVVLGVGEDLLVFKSDAPQILALLLADDATAYSVCYCSVLGDCWVYDRNPEGDETTSPVERCPTYPTKFVGVPKGYAKQVSAEIRRAAAAGAFGDASTDASAGAR